MRIEINQSINLRIGPFHSDPIVRFQQGIVSEYVGGATQITGYRGHLADGANRRHAQSRATHHHQYLQQGPIQR